jgi:hypothetical protein
MASREPGVLQLGRADKKAACSCAAKTYIYLFALQRSSEQYWECSFVFFSLKSEFDNSEKYRFMLDLGLWFVVARRGCHDALCHAIRVQVVSV